MPLDVSKVLVGAPDQKTTGAILSAPLGTALPKDASSALDAAFTSSGYVSEDGLSMKTDRGTTNVSDWSRKVVRKLLDSFEAELSWSEIQMSYESLCHAFGEDNVKLVPRNRQHGEQITVSVNASMPAPRSWVFNMKDGNTKIRIVVPSGQVTGVDELTFAAGDPLQLPITLACYPDDQGNHVYVMLDDGTVEAA
ncbi:hypothetical protein HLV35_03105 [Eggerthellaceae bacterium zg-997]|nr:hypothetical protein [Eggerthellaceae bacterium zg-997]